MAKATEQRAVKYNVTLNEEEAIWLKGCLQNPHIYHHGTLNESACDKNNRERIWKALHNAGVLQRGEI